jgi:hypothetical protein
MRGHRRRSFVPSWTLAVALIALVAAACAVCAGAAAPARAAALPARAAALPARGVWSSVIGPTTNTERWVDVARGANGSLYAGGESDLDVGAGSSDLMVARFADNDAGGRHLLWSRTWDNPAEHLSDTVSAIAVDKSGAVIAVGASVTTSSGTEWVVAKWSAAGVALWQRTFPARPGTAWSAHAVDVACTPAGAIYVCGSVQTGTHAGSPVTALVVRKLGSDGHVIWKRGYSGAAHSFNEGVKLALDGAGNAYVTGTAQSARGNDDLVTVRFGADNGRIAWVRRVADAKHLSDGGTALALRGKALWVTGYETTSSVDQRVVLARYTLAGKQLWVRTWLELAKTLEYPRALAVDARGNAVVVGAGTNDPVTREHAFVLRYTAAGRLTWQRLAYDSLTHKAVWNDVACDAAGHIFTGGYAVGATTDSLLVARYSAAGAHDWLSQWNGPDALGAECDALCLGTSGVFAAGSVVTPTGNADALAVKLTR